MKRNLPLILGGIIVGLLVVIMVFPQLFTSLNPYSTETIKFQDALGSSTLAIPPFPPGQDSPLGTDQMGRDVLSFIIYGTRMTIVLGLLVVLGRYLVALPLGLAAGFGSYICRAVINQFNVTFSAIPALIISVIVLKMSYFVNLDRERSELAFILVLTLVGWPRLGLLIMERVQEILARPFIKGEVAIGKRPLRIALENVIPHLAPELVILFCMEIAAALAMIMQLGIYTVFVGNLRFVADTTGGVITWIPISFEPEWSSMLAVARNYIQTAPWLVIYPALAFFISILGFNLLGEGLRAALQKRDSRFVVQLRKLLKFNIRGISFTKGTLTKTALGLSAIALLLLLVNLSQPHPKFSLAEAGAQFPVQQFDQVTIGTDQAKQTAAGIARALNAMGLEPLDPQGFVVPYPIQDMYSVTDASLEVSSNNQAYTYTRGTDFAVTGFVDGDVSGGLYDARQQDLYSVDYTSLKDKFVLMDSRLYPGSAATELSARIMSTSQAAGVLIIAPPDQKLPGEIGNQVFKGVVVWITPQAAERIVQAKEPLIRVKVHSSKLANQGQNVIGVIKGRDNKMDDESIIIGLGYNFKPGQQETGRKKILFGLELAKQLQKVKTKRNIIFAFWDGTISSQINGVRYFSEHTIISPNKIPLYIDLSQLDLDRVGSLYFRTDMAPITSYFAFSVGHQLDEAIKSAKLPQVNYNSGRMNQPSGDHDIEEMINYQTGIPSIILKSGGISGSGSPNLTFDSVGQVLLQTLLKNSY